MFLKRFLILLPLVLVLGLAQSYFWVPTYEKQTAGSEERLEKFISAISGDARLLNPIVSADSASGQVVSYVFDALLDIDENLQLRPHLAKNYKIFSLATLAVARGGSAEGLLAEIQPYLSTPIVSRSVLAGESRSETIDPDGPGPLPALAATIDVPERLRLELGSVDPGFFDEALAHLGDAYGREVSGEAAIRFAEAASPEHLAAAASLAPLWRLQPVIDFELRDDVRFHDGEAFDAEDVRFTYQAIMDDRNLSPRRSDFEPIESVEVRDSHRVRVIYKRLFSPAISAWSYMGMLPEHLLNDAALTREMDERGVSGAARESFGVRDSRFNRAPIGTGAFRFGYWRTDEVIHLTRNDAYFAGPPEYRELYIRIIPDPVAREVEFRSGAVDTYVAEPHQAARYLKDPAYQPFTSLGLGYTYIGYNLRRPPFDDVRVRKALGMAINVEEIIDYVLYGEGQRTTGPYPIQTDWYDSDIQPLPYDPEGALALLAEAGYQKNADGFLEREGEVLAFNLISNNGNTQRKAILTIAQDAWRKLGVRCETRLIEWAVFLKDFVNTGDFDAVVLGWSLSELDPDLFALWHSSQTGPQQLNFVGYKNQQADRLIESLRREYDRPRQVEMSRALHQRIAADQPYTFLFVGKSTQVVDRKIVMVKRDASGEFEAYEPLRPSPTGRLGFYFNRWKKLEMVPEF